MIYYVLSGLLAAINMVLWGVYGDLLVEKFSFGKVLRSIVLGIFWSIFLFFVNPHLPLFIVAMIVISLERITTEIYKASLRVENQYKYKIPSDLNLKMNPRLRQFLGISIIIIVACAVYFGELPFNKIYVVVILSSFVAITGMLKDAPYEGFKLLTFFRSPAFCIVLGILFSILYPAISGKYLWLPIAGGERVVSECFKKIVMGRIPGKFKQIEFDMVWKEKRKRLLIIYVANISGIILLDSI